MAQLQGNPTRSELLEQAKQAPHNSGVYLMKDTDTVLYVGKAKNLKNRLTTYFQAAKHEVLRTEVMVGSVRHFEVILTETENEALILECTLIKKYKPKFNVLLKDDKSFPYIKVQLSERAPRLEWTRRLLRDGAKYFGPFPSSYAARQVLQLLTKTLKLRDCSDNTFRHRSRPCVLHQIDQCSAPCVGLISEADYRDTVLEAVGVLEGKGELLLKSLQSGMDEASQAQEYEKAAVFRDQIRSIDQVVETQGVLDPSQKHDRDVVAVGTASGLTHGVIMNIRSGKLLGVKHYRVNGLSGGDPTSMGQAELLEQFLSQHFLPYIKDPESIHPPREVLLRVAPQNVDLLESVLQMTIRVPENKTEEQLVRVAEINVKHALDHEIKKQTQHGLDALEDIRKRLDLEDLPHRIECYDISNLQDEGAVASRVVFVHGAPDKNLYRKYKIKWQDGQNDFAMMKEVLGRRFLRADDPYPQLLLVDGGKGQLSQAVAILEELQVQGVAVASIAKSKVQNKFSESGTYDKEVVSSPERVFLPNRKNPVVLLPHHSGSRLLTHLRDEAHRFAVSYQRVVRKKARLGSDD